MDVDVDGVESFIFVALASFILLCFITKWLYKPPQNKNLPPSPPRLPVVGNLHQLGSSPHRNLHPLARKHGPLMLLHLGRVPVLIVSSANAAREIMKTHDVTFANRPLYKVHNKLAYRGKDVVFGQYGDHWRKLKGLMVLQLLSSKRVQSFRSIREEETALLVERVRECSSGVVNLSEMLTDFINDVICRSAFGRKFSKSETGRKILQLLPEIAEVFGSVGVGAYIPWLSWIDRVNGYEQKVNRIAKEMDDFLEGVIQERIRSQSFQGKNGDSILDIMLEISDVDGSFNRESIKALLLDVVAAGTDTTSISLDWAMTELLRHPETMEKLQKEVRGIVREEHDITDGDLEKMLYLKAVIKETLRHHPSAPLLVPRVATKDVKVKEYDISAGTEVLINAWAIGRDPASWDEPEMFKPERFLNSSIDFKGLDFEFIPFGAGRRGCPGMAFAIANMEFVLANLMQKFNWKLPHGTEGKDLDMSERSGIVVHRGVQLLAVASDRS